MKPKDYDYNRRKKDNLSDDEFSEMLKEQGREGKNMRFLYLRNPMDVYIKKVSDESISY